MAFTPDRTMASAVRVTTRNVHTSTGTDTATTAVTVATETRISSSRHTARVSCADTTKASGAITTIAGATETMGVGRSKALKNNHPTLAQAGPLTNTAAPLLFCA